MSSQKKKAALILLLFLSILGAVAFLNLKILLPPLSQSPLNRGRLFRRPPVSRQKDKHLVTKIIDGDTIEVDNNQHIRLLGMNTEEIYFDSPNHPPKCRALKARDRLKALIFGKEVKLEKDRQEKDKYGRELAYVYLNGQMVNLLMVREGWADVMLIKPNLRYRREFIDAQIAAKAQRGKIQEACPVKICRIKGNINRGGKKIYYLPSDRGYRAVQISYQRGENWFCSEGEARKAGFLRSSFISRGMKRGK